MKYKYLLILLCVVFAFLPIGLLTDAPAWGEWDLSFYKEILGFIPDKMKNTINIPAIFPDYNLNGLNPVISYYLSAFVGVSIIFFGFYIFLRVKK